MSIVLNDNLKIEAPKLIDERFGPHVNLNAALAFITPALREMGLIFFVKDGSNLLEYWWPTTDLSNSGVALRSYQPLDADLTAIANIVDGATGFLKKTAPNTWSLDTTVVTASTVAGGELEGYYPNPTLKNSAVIGKTLTGFNTIGGGTIVDTDSILIAFGKVQNQLNALYGGMQFIDFWNASTNTPTIPAASLANKGNYYIVQVAGSTNIGGITDWKVGDWLVSNGSVWSKIDNTDAVVSVNGYTGAVSLTTSDIAEGSNLYYTDLRVKTYGDTLYSTLGHTHTFASLTSKPTTVGGYGITDAYTKTEIENFFGGAVAITGYNKTNWDNAFSWGNHALAGYVKGTGVDQRIPYFNASDTVTSSSRLLWNTTLNALIVNQGIAGTIGATLSGAFDGGSLQVWNGHELAVMGSNVGNSGDVATMIMKSNRGISTANGYIEIQGYYAGGTNTAPIIMQRQGGVVILGGIAAGTDTVSKLQVSGAIRQTSVTSAMLKASATGILEAAVAGTDYVAPSALSGYVDLTTNQTISGVKTFSGSTARLVIDRPAVTNFNGLSYRTANVSRWFVGMRENLSQDNYVVFNENTGTDAFRISISDNSTTLTGALSGTSASFSQRVQVTGSAAPSSGTGLELFYDGAGAGTLAFARGTGYIPNFMDGSQLQFFASSTEGMRLTTNRNLLIKTTTDNGTDALQVAGSGLFTSNLKVRANVVNTTTYGQLDVQAAGEAAINILGTAYSSIYFGDIANHIEAGIVYDHGTNTMEFRRSGNITALGISPTGAATFSSSVQATNITATNTFIVNSTTNNLGNINTSNATGGYLEWRTNGTTIADLGTATQIFGSGGSEVFGINARGARSLAFGTNNTSRFTIASDGAATFSSSVTATDYIGSTASYSSAGTISSNITTAFLTGTAYTINMPIATNGKVLIIIAETGLNTSGITLNGVNGGTYLLSCHHSLVLVGNGTTWKIASDYQTSVPCS